MLNINKLFRAVEIPLVINQLSQYFPWFGLMFGYIIQCLLIQILNFITLTVPFFLLKLSVRELRGLNHGKNICFQES